MLVLVNKIHRLNCSLKYLGIFKVKNKKNWKLDLKRLIFILSGRDNEPSKLNKQLISEYD